MRIVRALRPAWLPAFVLWVPVLVLGLVLLTGLDIVMDAVGDRHRVRVDLPGPAAWIEGGVLFALGILFTVMGVLLAGLAAWRPGPRRRLFATVAASPWFFAAAGLLALGGLFALYTTSGHVVDAASGGVQWRFMLVRRTGAANLTTAVVLFVAAAACLAAAIAPRRLVHGRRRAPETPPPVAGWGAGGTGDAAAPADGGPEASQASRPTQRRSAPHRAASGQTRAPRRSPAPRKRASTTRAATRGDHGARAAPRQRG